LAVASQRHLVGCTRISGITARRHQARYSMHRCARLLNDLSTGRNWCC